MCVNYRSSWIINLLELQIFTFYSFSLAGYLLFSYLDPLFPLSTLIFVLNYQQTSISSFFSRLGGRGFCQQETQAGDWRKEVWDQSIYFSSSWDHLGLAVPLKAGYRPLSYLLYTLFLGFQNSPSPGSFKTRGRDTLSGFLHYSCSFPTHCPHFIIGSFVDKLSLNFECAIYFSVKTDSCTRVHHCRSLTSKWSRFIIEKDCHSLLDQVYSSYRISFIASLEVFLPWDKR